MRDLERLLRAQADPENARFVSRYCLTEQEIIGVRIPLLERLLASLTDEERSALERAPSSTLHDFTLWQGMAIVSDKRLTVLERIELLSSWLPFVKDWLLTDTVAMRFKDLKRSPKIGFLWLIQLINTNNTYAVRFGIVLALSFYLHEDYLFFLLSEIATITRREREVLQALGWFYQKAWTRFPKIIESSLPSFDLPLKREIVKKICESHCSTKEDHKRLKELIES